MVFSSIEFLWFFMPVVLGLYALVPPRRRNVLLAAVSVVFYAWGAHSIVFVFLASILIRYHQIDDQIRHPPPRSERLDDLAEGFPRFALGLCKKVLIADQVAPIANAAFSHSHSLTTPAAWLGALAYTVQIYFDFSGYSD